MTRAGTFTDAAFAFALTFPVVSIDCRAGSTSAECATMTARNRQSLAPAAMAGDPRIMNRTLLTVSIALFVASAAFAENDEEILETLRASATEIYLQQLPDELPESFVNSGLSPSDIERLVRQLADDGAACFVAAVLGYADQHDVPLSDFVSADGAISFDGDSGEDFERLLAPCILAARQAAGLNSR